MWKILSQGYDTRLDILRNLHLYNIDQYLTYPDEDRNDLQELLDIEKKISRKAPICEVGQLFPNQPTYLVGGFIRDIILDKPAKDFDFKVKISLKEMIEILETNNYKKTQNLDLKELEYYVNEQARAVSIFCQGRDIDLGEMRVPTTEAMILNGDVNLNCCIYNVQTKKIENPSMFSEIKRRELRFCDINKAREQPLIVVSALKQISRIPEIVISEETKNTIASSIPSLITLIKNQPNLSYKIDSICNNLNSEQIYWYFNCTTGGKEFIKSYTITNKKLATTNPKYKSILAKDLSDKDRSLIIELLRNSYGNHFDESKAFPDTISSVIFEQQGKDIRTCCLIDGERIYSAAAKDGNNWVGIFNDLKKSNYNVWFTVNSNNSKVLALCSVAGFKTETNNNILKKILESKYPKYKGRIETYTVNHSLLFRKTDKQDYPQVLLRS